jgi:hypothetical protein
VTREEFSNLIIVLKLLILIMSIDIVVRDMLQELIDQALQIPDNCPNTIQHYLQSHDELESFCESNCPLLLEYLSQIQNLKVQNNEHQGIIANLKGEEPSLRDNLKKFLELFMIISKKENNETEYNEQKEWFDELW